MTRRGGGISWILTSAQTVRTEHTRGSAGLGLRPGGNGRRACAANAETGNPRGSVSVSMNSLILNLQRGIRAKPIGVVVPRGTAEGLYVAGQIQARWRCYLSRVWIAKLANTPACCTPICDNHSAKSWRVHIPASDADVTLRLHHVFKRRECRHLYGKSAYSRSTLSNAFAVRAYSYARIAFSETRWRKPEPRFNRRRG